MSSCARACATWVPARAALSEALSCSDPLRLDLNEVTLLFPLPTVNEDVEALLPLDALGPRGELLPESVYSTLLPAAICPPNGSVTS